MDSSYKSKTKVSLLISSYSGEKQNLKKIEKLNKKSKKKVNFNLNS